MDEIAISGRAYRPNSSRAELAELRVAADAARLLAEDGEVLAELPRAALRFEPRLGSAPRRATLPDGTLFETADHAAVAGLSGRGGEALHGLERFHPRLALALAGIVLAGWLIWRFGLDLMAAAAVALTPAPMIDAIDRGTLQTLDLTLAEPSTASEIERRALQTTFEALLAALDPGARAATDFRLEFRDMPGLGPNAVALPGGTVVVTDALLRQFPSPDVRAGVLAHEIGHIVGRHGLRKVYRSLGVAVLIALLAGDTVPIVEDIVLEGNVLISLSHSRRSERAADAFGVDLARRAGFDPAGLIEFFEWVAAEIGDSSGWLSTHPSSAERMQTLRRLTGRE